MSTQAKAKRVATLAEFLALPEERRFHELIAGEIIEKAAPSAEHDTPQLEVGSRLIGPFGRNPPSGLTRFFAAQENPGCSTAVLQTTRPLDVARRNHVALLSR